MKSKKRSREEIHADLMTTDPTYRRLAERIEARRSDADREAFPLGSEAFSREVTRRLEERLSRRGGTPRKRS
jgi:hypothetical protein